MKFKVSPENAIRSIKICVELIVCWPPPLSATKTHLFIRDILWLVSFLIPFQTLVPLFYTLQARDDFTKATNILSILIAISFTMFKMFMCRYHRSKFQIYFAQLDDFLSTANARERTLFESYINKCGPLYTFVGVSSILTSTIFSCSPIFLPQPFPGDVIYPFPVEDSPWLAAFLYLLQVIVAYQATSAVIVDFEIALILWFTGMQFDLLAEEFTSACNIFDINVCIEKHQKLLVHSEELKSSILAIIFAVTTVTTLGNLSTGYQLIHHQPITIIAEFIFMLAVMCMEVLMYAWPADNLKRACEAIGWAAYNSQWIGQSPEMLKNIQIVISRAQKPIVVSIGGLLPELNLYFYGRYLTTSFSYFTTLKAVAG